MKFARTTQFWWVIALLLLGALLRLHNLSVQDLWGDEAWTWYLTTQDDFWTTLAGDVHPPVYYGLVYIWSFIAGDSELALRYLSFLFGVMGVALMYPLGREIVHWRPQLDTDAAHALPLIAMFLLAIAEMEVHIAQEARSYSLQVMMSMVSMLAYLRWARFGGRRWLLLWILVNVGIVHTHYLASFTPVAQGIHAILFLENRKRVIAISCLIVSGFFFLPWMFNVVLGQQLGTFSGNISTDPSVLETLWNYRVSFFTQQWALTLGLTLFGLVVLRKKPTGWHIRLRPMSGSALLLLWLMTPVFLTYIANFFLPVLFDYRLSQIIPPIALLMALGVLNFRQPERFFLLLIIGVYGVIATDVYRPKPDWYGYAQQVSTYVQLDDAILSDFSGGDYTVTYYLGRILEPEIPVRSMWQWRYWEGETYEAGIFEYIESHDTVWVPHWNNADQEIFKRMDLVGYVQTDNRPFDLYGSTLNIFRYDRLQADMSVLASFDNGMSLMKASINPRGGVALLWRADGTIEADYTVAVFLLNQENAVVVQRDMPTAIPTSQWISDNFYFDGKSIDIQDIAPDEYQLGVAVYVWSPDGIRNALIDGQTLWLGRWYSLGNHSE